MVRPKDQNIWKHFRNSEDKSAICIYCDHKYKFAHISKMRNHLLKCTMYPDILKEDIEKKHLEAGTTHTHNGNFDVNFSTRSFFVSCQYFFYLRTVLTLNSILPP